MYTFWYLYNHTQHICLTILYKQYICTLLIQQIYITRTLHITKQLSRRTNTLPDTHIEYTNISCINMHVPICLNVNFIYLIHVTPATFRWVCV